MRIRFSIIIAVYILLNLIIGFQLEHLVRINPILFWIIFMVMACSPILGRFGVALLKPLGNFWIVFFYYAAIAAVLAIFIHSRLFIIGSYLLILLIIFYGCLKAAQVKVQPYTVVIPKVGSDLHVVMLADIHMDKAKANDYVEKMTDHINKLNPDLVLLAGDIFDDRDINLLQRKKTALKQIKARYGIYGVLGNHEYYTGNLNQVLSIFQECNINILRDKVVQIAGIYLVGREDASHVRLPLRELLKDIDQEKPVIMLDHQPVGLDEAEKNGIDLQLSGHTHQGQFFPNQLITRRIYENDYGYSTKGKLQVIVSSGYGTWGPPVRIGTQSEIVDLKIKFTRLYSEKIEIN